MNDERFIKAGEIFLEIQDLPARERQRVLEERSSGDALLKAEVESLLEADRVGRKVLPTPPSISEIEAGPDRSDEPIPGSVGPFRIISVLGEGGMGIVYLAQQEEPLRRRVALKAMLPALSTPRFVRRFRREGQALALMSHTNIARIYEAATTHEGHPYLIMEYIEGKPISEYCDTHGCGLRERIQLVIATSDGIQHAHQKGRIHQDIKPTNVLVLEQDGRPVPKVIDFGIAKETANESLAGRMSTEFRVVLGTPEYMSPEQVSLDARDVDTRTDVYSLGVLLYEILTGALPFDPETHPRDEMLRAIKEDTPPLASRRVEGLGEAATAVAGARSLDPRTLSHRLRGDLDWILAKALEKDRGARYQTPSEFAADLRRHLANEPVIAGPPSTAYRVRKFVQRHRLGVSAAAMLLVTLLVGIVGTTVGLVRARRAERTAAAARLQTSQQADRATREAAVAETVTDFLVGLFRVSDPSEARGNTITAREILDRGAATIRNNLETQPRVRARLMVTMASVYKNLGLYKSAQPLVESALETLGPVAPNGDLDVATALDSKGSFLKETGHFREARVAFEKAMLIKSRYYSTDSLPIASSLNNIGTCAYEDSKNDEAIPILQRALDIRQRQLPPDNVDLATSRMNLSLPLSNSSNEADRVKAREMLRTAVDVYRAKVPNSPDLAQAVDNLGAMFAEAEQYKEAEPLLVEALGIREHVLPADHPDIADNLTNLANIELSAKDYEAALGHYQRALGIYERANLRDHKYAADARNNLACLFVATHEVEKGRRLHREALASLNESSPDDLSLAADLEEGFAGYLDAAGLHAEALAATRRAKALRSRQAGEHQGS